MVDKVISKATELLCEFEEQLKAYEFTDPISRFIFVFTAWWKFRHTFKDEPFYSLGVTPNEYFNNALSPDKDVSKDKHFVSAEIAFSVAIVGTEKWYIKFITEESERFPSNQERLVIFKYTSLRIPTAIVLPAPVKAMFEKEVTFIQDKLLTYVNEMIFELEHRILPLEALSDKTVGSIKSNPKHDKAFTNVRIAMFFRYIVESNAIQLGDRTKAASVIEILTGASSHNMRKNLSNPLTKLNAEKENEDFDFVRDALKNMGYTNITREELMSKFPATT